MKAAYQVFCQSDMERVEVPVLAVIPLAEKFNLTIYDASYYFWLASALNVDLFTFDKVLSAAWDKR